MTIIYAVILFVLLIFPHELGHFLSAKAVGIKVNEFAFGMGPALFQREKGETLYSVRLVPIGGYCAMEGENEESEDDRAFNNKPAWAKIFVLFSGAGMNILISVLTLSVIIGVIGSATTTLGVVEKNYPAYEAGIRAGDNIVAIDGEKMNSWNDVVQSIRSSEGQRELTVERDGQKIDFRVTPKINEEGNMVMGISGKPSHSPFLAVKGGLRGTYNLILFMGDSLKQLFTGSVDVSELSGPVGIVTMAGTTGKQGMYYFGSLIALMSINLALINLLPLPALDGGRILFVFIRKVTGKMISDETEGKIHGIGMMLLLVLMIYVTFNDIGRLFS